MRQQAERREEQLEYEIATLQVEREPGLPHCACHRMVPVHAARTRGPFSAPPQYSMVQYDTVWQSTVWYSLHTFHRRRGPP
jgi:hypothetical protein